MKVLTAQQMQAIDRRAIDEIGLPGVVLMENAGRRAAEEIVLRYAARGLQRALVFAGKGNNGGDGYVIARHLLDNDWDVLTLVLAKEEEVAGDAAVNLTALANCGGQIIYLKNDDELYAVLDDADEFSLVVDALFGTGLTKPLAGLYLEAIGWMNCQTCPVVAVDIPSGIDGSTGRIMGDAVNADLTVSFALPKIGQVSFPGARHVGELVIADIGIPKQVMDEAAAECLLIDAGEAGRLLPRRSIDGHKGTFGHLLVLAGSTGKCGAAVMAAEAGLRGGAGLVTLACPANVQSGVAARLTEVMTVPLHDQEGEVSLLALGSLRSLAEDKQALAVGPGLGVGKEVSSLVRQWLQETRQPVVIDADGLNALAGNLSILDCQPGREIVLTPHPGEMSRLSGLTVADIQNDRFSVVREFAVRHKVTLVLKGARTLIASPDGVVHVNTTGHAGMASGGTGDVLTGLIGSLLAQGLPAMSAATLGVYLHGLAAERLRPKFGDAGLLASDLIYELPAARQALATEG